MLNRMAKFILFMIIVTVAGTERLSHFSDLCESYKGVPRKIAAITFFDQKMLQQVAYSITLFDGPTVSKKISVLGLVEGDYNKKMFNIIDVAFSAGIPVIIQHCEQGNVTSLMISSINQY